MTVFFEIFASDHFGNKISLDCGMCRTCKNIIVVTLTITNVGQEIGLGVESGSMRPCNNTYR